MLSLYDPESFIEESPVEECDHTTLQSDCECCMRQYDQMQDPNEILEDNFDLARTDEFELSAGKTPKPKKAKPAAEDSEEFDLSLDADADAPPQGDSSEFELNLDGSGEGAAGAGESDSEFELGTVEDELAVQDVKAIQLFTPFPLNEITQEVIAATKVLVDKCKRNEDVPLRFISDH